MERPPQLCKHGDIRNYFEIMEKLGEGTYGSVYKAKVLPSAIEELPEFHNLVLLQKSDTPHVAVKSLVYSESGPNIKYEIEIMKLVRGPNVLRCYGCFTDKNGTTHIVMDLCKGISLFNRIQNWILRVGNFSRADKQRILKDAAIGISALHDMNIVHRDISPNNIMICGNDVKIIDYGFSVLLTDKDHFDEALKWDFSGTFPDPQSPPLELSKSMDIWAWGQIAVHTYSGQLLITREDHTVSYRPLGYTLDKYQLKPEIVDLLRDLTDIDRPISKRPTLQDIISTMER